MLTAIKASQPSRHLSKPMVGAIALTIAYLGSMLFLYLSPPPGVFEPTLLLPVFNTIFAGALPLGVAFIAFRSYLAGGPNNMLLMGCGLLTFGSSAILAGWLIGGTQGINLNVTIYNVGALLGAIFHALCIVTVFRYQTADDNLNHKRVKVMGVISALFLFQLCLTLAALKGLTPVFFVQGMGPTPLRQGVLGLATVLYLGSALSLFNRFKSEPRPYYAWYGLSLLMLALGLVAAIVQPSVGSPMGWLNRGGHYLAGLYALIAVLATARQAHQRGETLPIEMAALFQQARMSYEILLEAVTEPIVTTDQNFRIIQWNTAAQRKFGYFQTQAVGRSLIDLVLTPASTAALQSSADQMVKATLAQPCIGHLIEVTGITKTLDTLSLELSLSGARLKGQLFFVCVFRDNTKRIAAEEAQRQHADELLRASMTRNDTVMSVLAEAVVTYARDGSVSSWNVAAESILGLVDHQHQNPSTLETRWQTIHEDGSAFLSEMHPREHVFRTGLSELNVVMGLCKPDGTITWLLINAVPIFEYKVQTPASVVVSFTDITRQKDAERKNQLIAEQLNATLDAIPDLMFVMTLQGKYLDVRSPRSELLLNPVQDLLGRFVRDVLPVNAASTFLAALQEADKYGHSSGKQYCLPLAHGETWFELSIARKATDPNGTTRFVVLSRDITERIRLQEKDLVSGLALNAISQGVLISTPEGLLISVNEKFKTITGFDESEILGRTCSFVQGPLTDKKTIASIRRAAAKKSEFKGQILNYRKDGSTFWNELSITPVLNAQGEVLNFVGVTKDITEQKSAELEIKRSNAEEHRLNRSLRMNSLCDKLIVQAQDEQQLLNDLCQVICQKGLFTMAWAGLVQPGASLTTLPVAFFSKKSQELESIKSAWEIEQTSGLGPTVLAMQTATSQIVTIQRGELIPAHWYKAGQSQGPHAVISIPLLHEDQLLGVLVIHSRKTHAFRAAEVTLLESLARNIAFGLNALRIRQELLRHQFELELLVVQRTKALTDLYNQSPCGYHSLDAEGRLIEVNQTELDLLGYTREEYQGHFLTEFLDPENMAKFNQVYPQLVRDGYVSDVEYDLTAKDGSRIAVLISANAIRGDKGQFVASRSTLIDNRVNLAQKRELNHLNSFLSGVLEFLPIGVLVLDKKRRVVLKNKLLGRLLGYPPELIDRPDLNFSELVRFNFDRGDHPDQSYESVLAGFLALMATQETVHFERLQHSGIYLSIGGQRIAEGWILLTYTDITASKLSAKALTDSQKLAHEANLAKSDFLSNMSHELRTPLNAVIGLTGLLAQSPMNRRQLDYAEKIQFSANALRVLIDDILDLSKIEANELHVENAPFSLLKLLNNTAAIMGLGVGLKPVEPVLDVPANVPDKLFGDALRIQQILLNLISNAVKFTEAGDIVLSVRYACETNALNLAPATLQFCVGDTGIGMTEETQKLIFNSFTQANESTSRMYGGSGLGLAISKRLAALMQGRLEVQSTVGQGTEFRLTLPIFFDHQGAADPQGEVADVNTPSNLKILIVDDHPLVRDLLTQTCRQWGWHARAVGSGAAALKVLMNRESDVPDYDLVLLDWHMPGMDGLALLREMYKFPALELLPVVLMVATAEIEQAVGASAEFNIDGLVAKPLTPSSLRKAVANALNSNVKEMGVNVRVSAKPLAGLHLLVAEDNALNQEVIEQILINAGAQVSLVGNGQLAVEALQATGVHFDAVLMDVQMPVMDGYAATKVIRDTLGLKDLPIIALTAHARPQDRETSRLSGMSGHLVKPLDVEELHAIVAKLVGLRTASSQIAASETPRADLNVPGLNLAEALKMFGGHHARYGQLLNKFVSHHGNDVVEARRQFSTGNLERPMSLLHDLSGVAGLLQAPELSRLAAAAESALLDGKTDNLLVLFDQLQAAMDTVSVSTQQFFGEAIV